MGYFTYLPNISLATRPIQFPWSEQQYQTAKNIFRRFKISDAALDSLVYYKQYTVTDADRPDLVSEKVYGDSQYDWVILLANNIINPYFDWPMPTPVLQDHINQKYDKPFEIKHYETNEVKNSAGDVVLPENQLVGEDFYKAPYWTNYDEVLSDAPEPLNTINFESNRKFTITSAPISSTSNGFESVPEFGLGQPVAPNGEFPIFTGSISVNLSTTGYIKRIDVLDGGSNYTYPPDVTFSGGMSGQSATAVIDGGEVTEIRLDGTKYDTTDATNIYEFSTGVTIAENGSGVGSTGGFNVGGTHLRFGDSYGERYATLNKVDMTTHDTVRVYAIRGNGYNGGETPDIPGVEELRLRYQIEASETPDNSAWITLGIVIPATPNGTGTGVLEPYDFVVPSEVRTGNVFFQLQQPGNSGPQFDHFAITTVNFINNDAQYTDSTITLTNNSLDTTGGGATAAVYLGKTIASINIDNPGSYSNASENISFSYYAPYGGHGNPGTRSYTPSWSLTGGAYMNANIVVTESGPLFQVGETVDFSNGASGKVTAYTARSGVFGDTGADVEINLTDWDSNNPVTNGMLFTGTVSGAQSVVKTFNSTSFTEPTYVDKLNNKFRYKLSRADGTSGWEKLVRDSFRYRDTNGSIVTLQGSAIVKAVSHHEYETRLNDDKRKIYILRERYLLQFIEEMKDQLPYKSSSDFISTSLKRSAV
tara:strand:+ start:13924 stop:16038 length:2115 start_codon:yes stop_codon:yes gene_type:complete